MTVQTEALLPLVELQPLQPANVDVPVAVAVSVSVVPVVNWLLQEDGVEQLIPEPVTVPVPLPAKLMVRIG